MHPCLQRIHHGSDWFLSLSSLARTRDAGHRWPGSGAMTFYLVLVHTQPAQAEIAMIASLFIAIASMFSCKQTGCLSLCAVARALARAWRQPGCGENDHFLRISGAWLGVAFCIWQARPTAEYREPIIKPFHPWSLVALDAGNQSDPYHSQTSHIFLIGQRNKKFQKSYIHYKCY